MNKFRFLKAFNSPFKRPKLKWYLGKIAFGTPYFFPRRWVKATPKLAMEAALRQIKEDERFNELNAKNGYQKTIKSVDELVKEKMNYRFPVPKKIGFDFVGLGYKTKWDPTDYRFEWGPMWSFVFLKWQLALFFHVPHPDHYWVCWLTYENDTDADLMSVRERIEAARKINPEIWKRSFGPDKKESICYWDEVLKEKYL